MKALQYLKADQQLLIRKIFFRDQECDFHQRKQTKGILKYRR